MEGTEVKRQRVSITMDEVLCLVVKLLVDSVLQRLKKSTIETIMDEGLHEYIEDFIRHNNEVGIQIETDFRFTG